MLNKVHSWCSSPKIHLVEVHKLTRARGLGLQIGQIWPDRCWIQTRTHFLWLGSNPFMRIRAAIRLLSLVGRIKPELLVGTCDPVFFLVKGNMWSIAWLKRYCSGVFDLKFLSLVVSLILLGIKNPVIHLAIQHIGLRLHPCVWCTFDVISYLIIRQVKAIFFGKEHLNNPYLARILFFAFTKRNFQVSTKEYDLC